MPVRLKRVHKDTREKCKTSILYSLSFIKTVLVHVNNLN